MATTYTAVVVGMLLVVLVVAASTVLAVRDARSLAAAAKTQDIRASITRLVENVTDAETGQRGFLLTGRETYLSPYLKGARDAPTAMNMLAAQIAGEPESEIIVDRLRALVAAKLDELAQTVAAMKAGRRDEAMDQVRSDAGQRDMADIRTMTAALAARQQASLVEQLAAVRRGGQLIVLIDALGLMLLLVLAAAIIWGTRRAVAVLRSAQSELGRANADLATVNERLETKVAQRTEDLTAANEEIQRFAYIVSHDLRAPLVNIMGFTGELEAATRILSSYVADRAASDLTAAPSEVLEAAREDLPEAIRFIKTSSAKMDRLIGAILKLSREGRRVMKLELIAMRQFLQDIGDTLQHQSEQGGSEIVIQAVPDLTADRVMLEQIFGNLLENALKYGVPGRAGRITVGGYGRGTMVVLEVRDNGRGIAARDRERVFELFRRAGDQHVPGEGIGLAHVRALVRRLGGTIDCDSEEGVGSTFRVVLPRVTPESGGSLR